MSTDREWKNNFPRVRFKTYNLIKLITRLRFKIFPIVVSLSSFRASKFYFIFSGTLFLLFSSLVSVDCSPGDFRKITLNGTRNRIHQFVRRLKKLIFYFHFSARRRHKKCNIGRRSRRAFGMRGTKDYRGRASR